MRVSGVLLNPQRASGVVIIPRPDGAIRFPIQSLSIERMQFFYDITPEPGPVLEYAMENGKIVRDEKGKAIERWMTRESFTWTQLDSLRLMRRQVLYVREALLADAMTSFDADKLRPGDPKQVNAWHAYADALLAELDATGISYPELQVLFQRTNELGVPTEEKMKEAAERFLPQAVEPQPTGPSASEAEPAST